MSWPQEPRIVSLGDHASSSLADVSPVFSRPPCQGAYVRSSRSPSPEGTPTSASGASSNAFDGILAQTWECSKSSVSRTASPALSDTRGRSLPDVMVMVPEQSMDHGEEFVWDASPHKSQSYRKAMEDPCPEEVLRKGWLKLHAIKELERRRDAGENLDELQLTQLQSKSELQMEVSRAMEAADASSFERKCTPQHPSMNRSLATWFPQRGIDSSLATTSPSGNAAKVSLKRQGSLTVQRELEMGSEDARIAIIDELRGNVARLIRSPHGNHVIKTVSEVVPSQLASFVAEEIAGSAYAVACCRFGCRVLVSMFKHHIGAESTQALVDEMMVDSDAVNKLCRHEFGHHCVVALLHHGFPKHRRSIVDSLKDNLWINTQDRSASYAVKTILSETPEQHEVANELLSWGAQGLATLKSSTWGVHVFRTLNIYLQRHRPGERTMQGEMQVGDANGRQVQSRANNSARWYDRHFKH